MHILNRLAQFLFSRHLTNNGRFVMRVRSLLLFAAVLVNSRGGISKAVRDFPILRQHRHLWHRGHGVVFVFFFAGFLRSSSACYHSTTGGALTSSWCVLCRQEKMQNLQQQNVGCVESAFICSPVRRVFRLLFGLLHDTADVSLWSPRWRCAIPTSGLHS